MTGGQVVALLALIVVAQQTIYLYFAKFGLAGTALLAPKPGQQMVVIFAICVSAEPRQLDATLRAKGHWAELETEIEIAGDNVDAAEKVVGTAAAAIVQAEGLLDIAVGSEGAIELAFWPGPASPLQLLPNSSSFCRQEESRELQEILEPVLEQTASGRHPTNSRQPASREHSQAHYNARTLSLQVLKGLV